MNETFSLKQLGVSLGYKHIEKLGDKLEPISDLIDWGSFRKFFNKDLKIGRPPYDPILMLKMLFLQGWYGISDEELEYQVADRFSFQKFLGFPNTIPDYSTVWRFREELTETNVIDKIWYELQRQISEKNIKVKEGFIQDATFIHADPGKKNSGMNNRGREAKTSRSKDGSWTKKGKKSIFGFKLHTKVQRGSKIIKKIGLSTAKTHDGRVDLSNPEDIIYRDRGYTGMGCKAKGDGTMKRGKLTPRDILRNKRITRKRCPGEHPFGTMHRSFKAGRTKLTTIARVFVQQVFVCMAYNVHRLRFLVKS